MRKSLRDRCVISEFYYTDPICETFPSTFFHKIQRTITGSRWSFNISYNSSQDFHTPHHIYFIHLVSLCYTFMLYSISIYILNFCAPLHSGNPAYSGAPSKKSNGFVTSRKLLWRRRFLAIFLVRFQNLPS